MAKITSPIKGHSGRSTFGPFSTEFVDGVAELPELNDGLRAYLQSRGYTITEDDDVAAADVLDQNTDLILAHAEHLDADGIADLLEREAAGRDRKGVTEGLQKLAAALATDEAAEGDDTENGGEEQ